MRAQRLALRLQSGSGAWDTFAVKAASPLDCAPCPPGAFRQAVFAKGHQAACSVYDQPPKTIEYCKGGGTHTYTYTVCDDGVAVYKCNGKVRGLLVEGDNGVWALGLTLLSGRRAHMRQVHTICVVDNAHQGFTLVSSVWQYLAQLQASYTSAFLVCPWANAVPATKPLFCRPSAYCVRRPVQACVVHAACMFLRAQRSSLSLAARQRWQWCRATGCALQTWATARRCLAAWTTRARSVQR